MCKYIYSLLIDKDLYESWNVSIKFSCTLLVYLYLLSGELYIFFSKRFPFLFLFLCYITNIAKIRQFFITFFMISMLWYFTFLHGVHFMVYLTGSQSVAGHIEYWTEYSHQWVSTCNEGLSATEQITSPAWHAIHSYDLRGSHSSSGMHCWQSCHPGKLIIIILKCLQRFGSTITEKSPVCICSPTS